MSPYEFVRLQNELDAAYGSMYLDGRDPHPDGTPWTLDDYKNVRPIDWQDEISQLGQMHEYSVSASGGTEKTTQLLLSIQDRQQEFQFLRTSASGLFSYP